MALSRLAQAEACWQRSVVDESNLPAPIGHVKVTLQDADKLHVLHPGAIIAYQGAPQQREDRFMNLAGVYRKRNGCALC